MEADRDTANGSPRAVFLVTGASGQIGYELVRELAPLGRIAAPGRSRLDLERPETIRSAVREIRPTVIVNAAAYTAVDRAETDRFACEAANAIGPGVLAEEARTLGATLIHYSTDYVFDGRTRVPYRETDATGPLNVYGATKLAGERAIADVGGSWLVLRTGWVYGTRGQNFLRTIQRLARERDELRIVDDQVGAPTWSRLIAAATAQIIAVATGLGGEMGSLSSRSGIYHLAAAGQATWCEFARAILARDSARDDQRARTVKGIATSEYPTPAQRPRWSVLDMEKVATGFGVRLPPWEAQLELALA